VEKKRKCKGQEKGGHLRLRSKKDVKF
jgi:hypothetical protein